MEQQPGSCQHGPEQNVISTPTHVSLLHSTVVTSSLVFGLLGKLRTEQLTFPSNLDWCQHQHQHCEKSKRVPHCGQA